MEEQYIALISDRFDSYDRYWIRTYSNQETYEKFVKRIKTCYDYTKYQIMFFKATESMDD